VTGALNLDDSAHAQSRVTNLLEESACERLGFDGRNHVRATHITDLSELASRHVTFCLRARQPRVESSVERQDRPLLRMGTRQGQTRAKVGDAKPTGLPRAQDSAFAKPAGLPNGPSWRLSSCRSGHISAARGPRVVAVTQSVCWPWYRWPPVVTSQRRIECWIRAWGDHPPIHWDEIL
jgi:hypothetical protein